MICYAQGQIRPHFGLFLSLIRKIKKTTLCPQIWEISIHYYIYDIIIDLYFLYLIIIFLIREKIH